jgi:tetratricopeptide (TPR) repeat protein
VLDSAVVAWRELPLYKSNANVRTRIATMSERFRALEAQEAGDYATAATDWRRLLEREGDLPPHELFFDRERYADALIESGRYEEALDQLDMVLEINPRLIRPLILAVEAHFALGQHREAEKYLEQLDEALRFADPDFFGRAAYARLTEVVN